MFLLLQKKSDILHLCIFSTKQTGFLGLWGERVDSIEYYMSKIEKLSAEVSANLLDSVWYLGFNFLIVLVLWF